MLHEKQMEQILAEMTKFMIKTLIFQFFSVANTAYHSEFHAVQKTCSGIVISPQPTLGQFWG